MRNIHDAIILIITWLKGYIILLLIKYLYENAPVEDKQIFSYKTTVKRIIIYKKNGEIHGEMSRENTYILRFIDRGGKDHIN